MVKNAFQKPLAKQPWLFFPSTKPSDGFPLHPEEEKKSVLFTAFGYLCQPHFLQLHLTHWLQPLPSGWSPTHHTHLHLRAFAFAVPCLEFSHSRHLHGSQVHCTVHMYIDTATCALHEFLLHIISGRSLSWLPCSACSLQSPVSVFQRALSTTQCIVYQGTCSISHVSLPTKNRDLDGPNVCHIEWNKSEKNNYHILKCVWNLKKMVQMNLFATPE